MQRLELSESETALLEGVTRERALLETERRKVARKADRLRRQSEAVYQRAIMALRKDHPELPQSRIEFEQGARGFRGALRWPDPPAKDEAPAKTETPAPPIETPAVTTPATPSGDGTGSPSSSEGTASPEGTTPAEPTS